MKPEFLLQVRSISLHNCKDLLLGLDFLGINPSKIPLTIHKCGNVILDFVIFEPEYSGRQNLNLSIQNLESFSMMELHVDEPFKVIQSINLIRSCIAIN